MRLGGGLCCGLAMNPPSRLLLASASIAESSLFPARTVDTLERYCAKSECRKASKAAAQAKWLNKPHNHFYFRGPENVERVQRWRERHPGYWRKKRSLRPDALQDLAPSEVSQNQPITINEIGLLADDFGLCEPSKSSKTPRAGALQDLAS